MIQVKKRPAPWLIIGLLGLIALAACSSPGPAGPVTSNAAVVAATEERVAEPGDTPKPDPTEVPPTDEPTPGAPPAEEPVALDTPEDAQTAERSDNPAVDESAADGPSPTEAVDTGEAILTEDDRTDLMRQASDGWNTNWNRHTVPYDELVPVLFRDAIRSLDEPKFVNPESAGEYLVGDEPVIAVEIDGDARAYPLRILTAHEIVNDNFGEIPVVITYCPLCNSALVFDRRLDGEVYEFGTSGWLRNSDLIMYDRTTESLWQQFTGEAIVGDLVGKRLTFLPSSIVSFDDFQQAFPKGTVLSIDTGAPFRYDRRTYEGYDSLGQDPFLFFGQLDRRLPATERVVSVSLAGLDIAYPVSELAKAGVINDTQNGQNLAIFYTDGTTSAFYNPLINDFAEVGATGVFDPNLDSQLLTFSTDGDQIVDDQTGSVWNILGQATEGPLAGEALTSIVHGDHFWFSWAAFKPDTIIYKD